MVGEGPFMLLRLDTSFSFLFLPYLYVGAFYQGHQVSQRQVKMYCSSYDTLGP